MTRGDVDKLVHLFFRPRNLSPSTRPGPLTPDIRNQLRSQNHLVLQSIHLPAFADSSEYHTGDLSKT